MKIFLWALSDEGGIWEELLTDINGQYLEAQFVNTTSHCKILHRIFGCGGVFLLGL